MSSGGGAQPFLRRFPRPSSLPLPFALPFAQPLPRPFPRPFCSGATTPEAGFEAFTAVPAVNRVHDVLHLRPSAAFHEASTRTRANTIPKLARSPPLVVWRRLWRRFVPERGLTPLWMESKRVCCTPPSARAAFSARTPMSRRARCRPPYYDFICSQGFQRQGGDLHTGVHGHV